MRTVMAAALVAGSSYCLAAWLGWQGPAITLWKGSGVGLLALWAAMRAQTRDGWLLALVMACGAVGDVLLDAIGLRTGAVAFLVGHVLAIFLYRRHRRDAPTLSQGALSLLIAPVVVIGAWAMTGDAAVAVYAAALGIMAATAWASAFTRYRVGLGAMMFVASDLLIFARSGPLAGSWVPTLLVWPLYFAGQALIAAGVATTLARSDCRPISTV